MARHKTLSSSVTPSRSVEESEAATYIAYTKHALRAWRRLGRGPAYIRAGRSIRYRIVDLDDWLMENRVQPRRGK